MHVRLVLADPVAYHLLKTVPGIGLVLALILLYEVHQISRFAAAGNFLSYSRLVRCAHESAGQVKGSGCKKIGNGHLRWAFFISTGCPSIARGGGFAEPLVRSHHHPGTPMGWSNLAPRFVRPVGASS